MSCNVLFQPQTFPYLLSSSLLPVRRSFSFVRLCVCARISTVPRGWGRRTADIWWTGVIEGRKTCDRHAAKNTLTSFSHTIQFFLHPSSPYPIPAGMSDRIKNQMYLLFQNGWEKIVVLIFPLWWKKIGTFCSLWQNNSVLVASSNSHVEQDSEAVKCFVWVTAFFKHALELRCSIKIDVMIALKKYTSV